MREKLWRHLARIEAQSKRPLTPIESTDAILAALPGMIPELEWEDGKHGYVSYNSIGYRIDTLISSGGESQLCYFGYEVAISLAKNANAVLKKKASEHHRQQFMKALGLA